MLSPEGVSEKNWIRIDPKRNYFLVCRFYGPLEDGLERTWVLNDIELVK